MLTHLTYNQVIFLDIETTAQYPNYEDLPERLKLLWDKKAALLSKNEEVNPENLYERAGIYAEFGKIVCISIGYYEKKLKKFRIKSFFGKNEKKVLIAFSEMLNKYFQSESDLLCAHNGKEFDFICGNDFLEGQLSKNEAIKTIQEVILATPSAARLSQI